jgi:hypothetical protein
VSFLWRHISPNDEALRCLETGNVVFDLQIPGMVGPRTSNNGMQPTAFGFASAAADAGVRRIQKIDN